MKNYFEREYNSSIFFLLNLIHPKNIVHSSENLLPKYFSPKWIYGHESIMHLSNLISVAFWIMAVSKVETRELSFLEQVIWKRFFSLNKNNSNFFLLCLNIPLTVSKYKSDIILL